MADPNSRDAKLIQYLNEAYAKEKELEVALQAHIGMNSKPPYRKRLQQHLKETKSHARQLERRVKQLGGGPGLLSAPRETVAMGAGKVAALARGQVVTAKGPLHAVRGTSEEETLLKNAKTEYWNEHEEIATYVAIETLAEAVGDNETAKLARGIRRDEERMASFLERQIPTLTRAVARAEIPSKERRTASRRRRASKSKASAQKSRASGSTKRSRSSGSRSKAGTSTSSRRRRTGRSASR